MSFTEIRAEPRYVLRYTARALMIDKEMPAEGFDPPLWTCVKSFGPFRTKEQARQYMIRHEGQP